MYKKLNSWLATGFMLLAISSTSFAKDIVDVAATTDGFGTLVAAVKAAGLVETLKGDGPFTVFAPTDEAFAKLPKETLDSLLKPENKSKLVSILTYHVVPGRVAASDVVGLSDATSVQGSKIAIQVVDGKVVLNGRSTVVQTDIETSNGLIHVIDTVILPPEKTSQVTPRSVIQSAIAAGAPQYNSGHARECCVTYTNAIHELMNDHSNEMSCAVRKQLHTSLGRAEQMQCQDSRAWALRRALDHVHASM